MEPGKGKLLIKARTNSSQLEQSHHTQPDLKNLPKATQFLIGFFLGGGGDQPREGSLSLVPFAVGTRATSTPVSVFHGNPPKGKGRIQQRAGKGLHKSPNLKDPNWNPGGKIEGNK